MRVSVKKWGNSASVRIPAAIMQSAHLSLDQVVEVREEEGRIIIEPVHEADNDLDALLSRITEENLHGEISTGNPLGNEVW